jgi:TPR repeat protein
MNIIWKAAAKLGFRKAIIHVANCFMDGKKYKEAIEWYKKVLPDDEMKAIRRKVYYLSLAEMREKQNRINKI